MKLFYWVTSVSLGSMDHVVKVNGVCLAETPVREAFNSERTSWASQEKPPAKTQVWQEFGEAIERDFSLAPRQF